ncbi:protein cbp-1-like [Aricia agestis]|uniref:protein cbp-1-like n=1 Tax=Aricia agestis TaxID=91739 RepID=UPI001C209B2E|nr:protein cbp-1-like [Aricia agestis]
MKMPNSLEAHKQFIYRCVQTLEHSCKCSEAKCRLGMYSCQKMKLVFYHTRVCRRKLTDNCGICRQLVVLCCHHARGCRARHCVVPYCCQIKKRGDLRSFRDPVIYNHIN